MCPVYRGKRRTPGERPPSKRLSTGSKPPCGRSLIQRTTANVKRAHGARLGVSLEENFAVTAAGGGSGIPAGFPCWRRIGKRQAQASGRENCSCCVFEDGREGWRNRRTRSRAHNKTRNRVPESSRMR